MDTRNHDVVQPFPGIPGLPAHGRGKGIGPGNRMGVQHQFAIADVPSDAGVAQQAQSENPAGHGSKQNDENQISDGGNEKSKPSRSRRL